MRSVLSFLLFTFAAPLGAQVSIHAYVDKTVLGDAETLAFTLEITGDLDELGPIQPPGAHGLTLAQSTPVLRSQVVTNGEEHLTLRWLYRPQRTGQSEILSARIPVGGRILETDPISIEVVPQSQRNTARASRMQPGLGPKPDPPGAAEGDLFVRAEPSSRSLVPGQQVVVDYVLYVRSHLRPRRSQVTGTWDAEGFWREELEVPDRDTYPRPVTIGGEDYDAVTLRRMALFPTRTGQLEIGEMKFEVELARVSRPSNPFGPLFSPFTSRFSTEDVTAPALTLTSSALPGGAPESFGGAVGQFGMAAFTDREDVAAGDPIQLTVEIRGTGNIATLAPPEIDVPPEFDQFDPQQERRIDRQTASLSGTKTFTFTLVPRGGGSFEIPPVEWTYYDPVRGRYQTLRSSAFPVEVSGPVASSALIPEATPSDPSVPLGLMTEAVWLRAQTPQSVSVLVLFGGFTLPLLALFGLVAVRRIGDRQADASVEALALRAHPEARKRLKEARKALGDAPVFYDAIERALRAFLSERLGTPVNGLSRSTLQTALAKRGISAETRKALDTLLAECERAQFAPGFASGVGGQIDVQEAAAKQASHLFAAVDDEADLVSV